MNRTWPSMVRDSCAHTFTFIFMSYKYAITKLCQSSTDEGCLFENVLSKLFLIPGFG